MSEFNFSDSDFEAALIAATVACEQVYEDEVAMLAATEACEQAYEADRQLIQQTGSGLPDLATLTQIHRSKSRKFGFDNITYRVEVNEVAGRHRLEDYVDAFFKSVIRGIGGTDTNADVSQNGNVDSRKITESDMIRFSINHPGLTTPINLPFTRYDQLTSERITEIIAKTMQSCQEFYIDSQIQISIIVQPQYNGGRRTQHTIFGNIDEKIANKRCVVQIKNRDKLCMLRALVVGKAKIDNDPQFKHICEPDVNGRQRRWEQSSRAHELAVKAGITAYGPHDVTHLNALQLYLKEYRIIAIDAVSNRIIFDGGFHRGSKRVLGLLHHNNHYHALLNVAAWFEGKRFCYGCLKRYEKRGQHRCKTVCDRCYGSAHEDVDSASQFQKCQDCLRVFYTPICFDQHKAKANSQNAVCDTVRICKLCGEYWNGFRATDYGAKHECGKRKCRTCSEMVEFSTHVCFMQPITAKPEGNEPTQKRFCKVPYKFIFWDSEARQENEGLHEPNLFIAHITCEKCIDDHHAECSLHENRFVCKTTTEFGKFVLRQKHATFIAHNFKGYDSQFVLDYCRANGIKPEVIMNGLKCTYLYIQNHDLRFIDSLNFMPMALSKLPKTFGFTEMRKGYFPHFFNTEANAKYVGPLPAKHFYGYNHMQSEARTEFDLWYDEETKNGTIFNMEVDIVAYCDNDVAVLRVGCAHFRKLLISIADTDPFRESLTIASVAQLIFRKLFLREKQIGLIPPNGYRPKVNQSRKALQWLSWVGQTKRVTIRDCRHPHGEYRIGNYQVDGYDESSKTVYEFLGSYWHGDLSVFNPTTFNQRTMCPMSVLNERTMQRQLEIERAGYKYESIWESVWDSMIKKNTAVREFVERIDITSPLEPRDAFFGGRTNACKLYYKRTDTSPDKVYYIDFCSLYPTVNKYGRYPVGHPEIITEFQGNESLEDYYGLCKCTVLPPQNLYHPVLPYRHPDGKLMFPLCIRCADTYRTAACTHNEHERRWLGTWTTIELLHAVARGYKILRIYEIWHFAESIQYNKDENTPGLFSPYVDMFMKIKQESSGLPPNVESDVEIENYINEFHQREGIKMDRSKIQLNPGLRYVSKLFLNSLWGKFGQRSNLPRTVFVSVINELNTLLQRTDIEVNDLVEFKGSTIDDDICQVQYKMKSDFVDDSATTNIFIAAFTTSQARLMLLKELEKLDRRVLYFDTDSIIYISKPNELEPVTGCFLGELTHELKPGEHITEFFSGGPKNYGYKTSLGKTVQKHKGITLNAHVLETLSFETARDIVIESAYGASKELAVEMQQIRRLPHATGLRTVTLRKRYGFGYDKRVIISDFDTLPYGHIDIRA